MNKSEEPEENENDKLNLKLSSQKSLIKINISSIDKSMFTPLSEIEVKHEELIKDIYKVNDYETIIKNITKSIDDYYSDVDNFDDYPYFKGILLIN